MNLTDLTENTSPTMSDEEFERLKREIEMTAKRLRELQAAYRQQTGRDYRPFV